MQLIRTSALVLSLAALATAADPAPSRAKLQATADRKPAPQFVLKDSAGNTVTLKKYRGKIVVLDFWATWCHGCKEEIPWFAEFERKYSKKGLTVIGVSMDGESWKVITPFLAKTDVPYRIVLGDDAMASKYKIETMPDTFLIDRHGKLAATYVGMVDRGNIEANIQALLAQQ